MSNSGLTLRLNCSWFLPTIVLLAICLFQPSHVQAELLTTGASTNSVILSWTATGDDGNVGTASVYDIRYSTSTITDTEVSWDAATQVTGEPVPQVTGSSESFTVNGLEANTTYYFAIKASDESSNWSALSNVVTATTDPEPVDEVSPDPVTDLLVTDVTSASVSLSWTATGDDGNVGTASVYDIRYSTSTITEVNWPSASLVDGEPQPQAPGNSESFTVTGLGADTLYYFAIKVGDEVPNLSVLSNVVTATTDPVDEISPDPVTNLLVTDVTSATVSLSWTATGDDGNIGTASVYDIRYSTSTITEASWASASLVDGEPQPQAPGNSESFTVTGLGADTPYYFAIKVGDEIPNWSILSNVVTATTDLEPPPPDIEQPDPVTDLLVIDSTDATVTLSWTATGDDGNVGTASVYDIRYSTSPITEANWAGASLVNGEPQPQAPGNSESFTVDGLGADTPYYFAIKIGDEVPNWSILSNVVTAKTLDQTAGAPISDLVASTGINIGELDISWSAPGDNGNVGTSTVYIIMASTETITELNWPTAWFVPNPPVPQPAGSPQSYTFTGLTPSMIYYIAIKSIDESGNISLLSNNSGAIVQWSFGLGIDDESNELPTDFHLAQNYPNPFNPNTTIEYSVPTTCHVRISVYNIQGQLINTMIDETRTTGRYSTVWDGTDASHSTVASGVYFYRLEAGSYSSSQKMILLK